MNDNGLLVESRFSKGSLAISIDHCLPWDRRVDAAVFPMIGGGSLGSKHLVELAEAGGPALMSALSHSFNSLHTLEAGKAIMIPAGGLPCKFIILAGYPYHCTMEDLEGVIASCLMLAELAGLKRVGIPVGAYENSRMDTDTMAQTLLNGAEVFLSGGTGSLKEISFSTLDLHSHTTLINKACYLKCNGWVRGNKPLDLSRGARLAYFNGRDVVVRLGNITEEDVDALVVPTSATLTRAEGATGTILDTAGECVRNECMEALSQHGPFDPGSVVVTGGGTLGCRHIMHVVMPTAPGNSASDILEEATDSVMRTAERQGLNRVALLGLTCGDGHLPNDTAAELIQSHVRAFMHKEARNLRRVVLCDTDEEVVNLFITTALDI